MAFSCTIQTPKWSDFKPKRCIFISNKTEKIIKISTSSEQSFCVGRGQNGQCRLVSHGTVTVSVRRNEEAQQMEWKEVAKMTIYEGDTLIVQEIN
jgi:hypothetical protein